MELCIGIQAALACLAILSRIHFSKYKDGDIKGLKHIREEVQALRVLTRREAQTLVRTRVKQLVWTTIAILFASTCIAEGLTDTDGYMEFEARLNHMELCQVDDFLKVVDFDIIKCLMTAEPEVAEQYEKELAELVSPDLNVFRSEPYFIEITVKGVDKAESIARLLEHIGMKREQCICCGDGFNDKTMVEYAGVGVAMGNAQQVVKDVADYVTASCDEDGLVEVIKKFVL